MAGSTTNISIRMDVDLKAHADTLFNELGMNLSTAFNIIVRQSLRVGRIHFDISLNQPNAEAIAAMQEAERIVRDPNVKRYSDVEEALRELKDEFGRFICKMKRRRTEDTLYGVLFCLSAALKKNKIILAKCFVV